MKILVLNSGSSSLKYKLLEMPQEEVLAFGQIERIGEPGKKARLVYASSDKVEFEEDIDCINHIEALKRILEVITDRRMGCISGVEEIGAVGHRVVHGKDIFSGPILVSEEILCQLRECVELAPLHMPANVSCIEACNEVLDGINQIAHFDTAFYRSMPKFSTLYPVPFEWHEKYAVRRYGFHGISHQYVTCAASEMLGIPLERLRLITAHLGNGASITAFKENRVVDTSMGFTPLEGLMMGTRCGFLDPAVLTYISSKTGAEIGEIEKILNNESGLAGISGIGRDMRNILDARAQGHERAELAFQMFVHTLRKYIGGYYFILGGADAIVFTAGIGENSPEVRAATCDGLENIGIVLDHQKNEDIVGGKAGFINSPSSRVKIVVIPTNEEVMIARETYRLIQSVSKG